MTRADYRAAVIATVIHYRGETLTILRERRPYGAGVAAFLVAMQYTPAAPAGPQRCAARRGKSA